MMYLVTCKTLNKIAENQLFFLQGAHSYLFIVHISGTMKIVFESVSDCTRHLMFPYQIFIIVQNCLNVIKQIKNNAGSKEGGYLKAAYSPKDQKVIFRSVDPGSGCMNVPG